MEKIILQKIIDYDNSRKAALCTQIDWKGSVPRKDFPMMLVDEAGEIIGTIGGGALEHEAIEIAKDVITVRKPIVQQFNLTNQDVSKTGSICGGVTTILIEPYTSHTIKILKAINSNSGLLVTKITEETCNIDRQVINNKEIPPLPKKVSDGIAEVKKSKFSKSVKIGNTFYLIQYFGQSPVLHIFGAGHVGQAVAETANFIGIETKIYDERKDLNNAERFPFTSENNTNDLNEIVKSATINPNDFVLVATRGHQHDFELMQWLLQKELSYISLVSSNKKWQLLSEALMNDGISENKINQVHSPVGLDIGSETVPEIAISIIAELINHYRKQKKSAIALSKI